MSTHSLYHRPSFLLRRAHQIAASIFERACADLSLTPAQYGVLCIVNDQPGIDQTSLARALAFDKVTVLRVLKGLQSRGLCQRRVSPENRRQMAVHLTPAGTQLLGSASEPVQLSIEILMSPFSQAERVQFIQLLTKFTQSLEGHARSGFVPLGSVA